MSNRNYSYIFSPVLSSGNISSQSLTGLYNLQCPCCLGDNMSIVMTEYPKDTIEIGTIPSPDVSTIWITIEMF